MMTVKDIKTAHTRLVSVLVKEMVVALRLRTYKDVYAQDELIERYTAQRTSLLPSRIRSIVDLMVMDALCLHFEDK